MCGVMGGSLLMDAARSSLAREPADPILVFPRSAGGLGRVASSSQPSLPRDTDSLGF